MNKMFLIGVLCVGLAGNLQKVPAIKFPLVAQSVFEVERQAAALNDGNRSRTAEAAEAARSRTEPLDE
jgi:hypothetical protein